MITSSNHADVAKILGADSAHQELMDPDALGYFTEMGIATGIHGKVVHTDTTVMLVCGTGTTPNEMVITLINTNNPNNHNNPDNPNNPNNHNNPNSPNSPNNPNNPNHHRTLRSK